jgi:hypothetical protein
MPAGDLDPSAVIGSPAGEAALQSLNAVERVLSGRLIVRQMLRSPRARAELNRYGVEGTVQLYAATALRLYMVILVLAVSGFAVLDQGEIATAILGLVLLLMIAGLARLAQASRSGRKWRASRANPR